MPTVTEPPTPADDAREAMTAVGTNAAGWALTAYDGREVSVTAEGVDQVAVSKAEADRAAAVATLTIDHALAAEMPDGRTVAQTLNDGAEWEKWGRAAGAVLRHLVGNPSIAEAISSVPADPDFVAILAKLDAS
jgi:hypothetical protein